MEQIKKPSFQRLSQILKAAKSPIIDGFEFYKAELKKYYDQARNNVQFLATILQYFKVKKHCFLFGKASFQYSFLDYNTF